MVDFDTSSMAGFAKALDEFPGAVLKASEKVMDVGVTKMKKNLIKDASKSKHFWPLSKVITYDKRKSPHGWFYELGPDKEKSVPVSARALARPHKKSAGTPGDLAGIAYFGGANGGGGSLDFDAPVNPELEVIDGFLHGLGKLL